MKPLAILLKIYQMNVREGSSSIFEYINEMSLQALTLRNQFDLELEKIADDSDIDWDSLREEYKRYNINNYHYLYTPTFIWFYSFYEKELKVFCEVVRDKHSTTSIPGKKRDQSVADRFIAYLRNWYNIPSSNSYETIKEFGRLRNNMVHENSSTKSIESILEKYHAYFAINEKENTFYIVDVTVFGIFHKAILDFSKEITVKL